MRKIGVISMILVAVATSNCGHGKGKEPADSFSKTDGTGRSCRRRKDKLYFYI